LARSQVNETSVRQVVRIALCDPQCRAVLILFDSDDDCHIELAQNIRRWIALENPHIPCEVVIARREFECWFLGAIESLRGTRGISRHAASSPNPESVRGAKERLSTLMGGSRAYSPSVDQAALSSQVSLPAMHCNCRSFRKLVKTIASFSSHSGRQVTCPPAHW